MPKIENETEKAVDQCIQLMSNVELGKLRTQLENRLHNQELLTSTIEGLGAVYAGMISEKRVQMDAIYDGLEYRHGVDAEEEHKMTEEQEETLKRLTHEIGALHRAIDKTDEEATIQKRRAMEIAGLLAKLD